MTATESIKLICPECRHENESERIYCHDCGTRLDRSPIASRRMGEDPAATQKRVKNMFDPTGVKLRLAFFKVAKVVLAAAALAALAEIMVSPELPELPKSGTIAPQIAMDLENAATYHRLGILQYSQQDVNAYLASALKNKKKALDLPLINFERAIVQFKDGECAVTTERSIFGYSLFLTSHYQVSVKDGKPVYILSGANLGRLPVHPEIMKHADFFVADVVHAMTRERMEVAKLSSVKFDAGQVLLTPSI